MTQVSGARVDTFPRRIHSVVRRWRKLVRSVPARLRHARAAFSNNVGPSPVTIGQFGALRCAFRRGGPDEAVLTESFDRDLFFPAVPAYRPAPGDTILDVGAHLGAFSLLAATRVPHGKVYAVEACAENCDLVQINAALNGLANIDIEHLALAGHTGTARLFHNSNSGSWGHTITMAVSSRGETVAAETLGDYFERKHIAHCELAKFNCEGAEFPILLNSTRDVLSRVGHLIVLYHCDLAAGYRQGELADHLSSCGFDCDFRNQGRNRGWLVCVNRNFSGIRHTGRGAAA